MKSCERDLLCSRPIQIPRGAACSQGRCWVQSPHWHCSWPCRTALFWPNPPCFSTNPSWETLHLSSPGALSCGNPLTRLLLELPGAMQQERGTLTTLLPHLQLLGYVRSITHHRIFAQVFHNINITFVMISTFWQFCCYQQHSKYCTRWWQTGHV